MASFKASSVYIDKATFFFHFWTFFFRTNPYNERRRPFLCRHSSNNWWKCVTEHFSSFNYTKCNLERVKTDNKQFHRNWSHFRSFMRFYTDNNILDVLCIQSDTLLQTVYSLSLTVYSVFHAVHTFYGFSENEINGQCHSVRLIRLVFRFHKTKNECPYISPGATKNQSGVFGIHLFFRNKCSTVDYPMKYYKKHRRRHMA